MLKRLLFGLILIFFATPAMAQVTAAGFVETLKPMEGKPLGDTTIILVSARAEDSVVVLTLDSADWGVAREQITGVFLQGFCASGDDKGFFDNMQLRVDTLEKGQGLTVGEVIDKCPAEGDAE